MQPDYWLQASAELAARDRTMATLVEQFAGLSLASRGDPFSTLVRSIVGQQISVKAADSVWARFVDRVGEVRPSVVLACAAEGLAGCGLSGRKIEYLLDLAAHFVDGRLVADGWQGIDDEALIVELCRVRGIGRWTAEMFLIFNQMRPDVFPVDDIGLQKAVGLHYFSGARPTLRQLRDLGERWRPWRSVATWYLWRSLDPIAVEY
ncbi:DNA-3-methyladenine glycosylase [Azonexus sp. R2A61]|uniref:DNA-3-methyladenine glycosylase family protein n=1 Tax=Azonexus sp. R2A61 TaxID=2744443 RepID=UPI001F3A4743|nr:DNA-3-methyladenine glycosylase [Azonexus sp. R2A61]